MHFAVTEQDVNELRAMESEVDRIDHVTDVIEEHGVDGDWAAQSDKAWDAIHRCFDNGDLTCDGGEYPLNHVIFGGEQLVTSGDYYISLKTPEQVRDIAAKIGEITRAELSRRYRLLDPAKYGYEITDEDEGYVWHWFEGVAAFYQRAAKAGRWVIFTVDQ